MVRILPSTLSDREVTRRELFQHLPQAGVEKVLFLLSPAAGGMVCDF
jgi:hypothetical protein